MEIASSEPGSSSANGKVRDPCQRIGADHWRRAPMPGLPRNSMAPNQRSTHARSRAPSRLMSTHQSIPRSGICAETVRMSSAPSCACRGVHVIGQPFAVGRRDDLAASVSVLTRRAVARAPRCCPAAFTADTCTVRPSRALYERTRSSRELSGQREVLARA